MNISRLTFGQLYKLAHPTTLMRVTRAYHQALDRASRATGGDFGLVLLQEKAFPEIAARYRPVLAFLRGPELKAALRKAAQSQTIPFIPGQPQEIALLPIYRSNQRLTEAHAEIIYSMCKFAGASADIVKTTDCLHRPALKVVAYTTPMGANALIHRMGLKWSTIKKHCRIEGQDPFRIFWWLALVPQLNDNDRVNPAVWPVNTPDVSANAETLITRAA